MKFNPLLFLIPLGAGGVAVAAFAYLNFTIPHDSMLISALEIRMIQLSGFDRGVQYLMEAIMVAFSFIHVGTLLYFLPKLFAFIDSNEYQAVKNDPLRHAILVTPFIAITMTMNVMLAVVRYFIPVLADNLQALMIPGFIAWGLIWVSLLSFEIQLLRIAFSNSFDVSKIQFGWLLHPFALGMVTVTGTGIAAMAANFSLATAAGFMALISGSMGFFLLIVKLITLFKARFSASDIPSPEFLPSVLIVIPNITLYAIAFWRFGHYAHKAHDVDSGFAVLFITLFALAFETWYWLFGISLLRDYLKNHFSKNFNVVQWSFICPLVAYPVLMSFAFSMLGYSAWVQKIIAALVVFSAIAFGIIARKHIMCSRTRSELVCD